MSDNEKDDGWVWSLVVVVVLLAMTSYVLYWFIASVIKMMAVGQ